MSLFCGLCNYKGQRFIGRHSKKDQGAMCARANGLKILELFHRLAICVNCDEPCQ